MPFTLWGWQFLSKEACLCWVPSWVYSKGLFPLNLAEHQIGNRIRGQIGCLLGSLPVTLFVMLWVQFIQNCADGCRTAAELELETAEELWAVWKVVWTFLFSLCLCPMILSWVVHLIFHNRDNVEWSEEQEASARSKVQENSSQLLPQDKQGTFGQPSNAES